MNSWYILRIFSHHLKLLGPMRLDALKEDLSTGKILFSDYIYQPDSRRKWVRAFEIDDLLSSLPEAPSDSEFSDFESQISDRLKHPSPKKPPIKKNVEETAILEYGQDWYLQFEGVEFGPFTYKEAEKLVKSGKFSNGTLLIWHKTLINWLKVSAYQILEDSLAAAIDDANRMIIEKGANQRTSKREILTASVSVRLKRLTAIAVCWDISEGGLQAFGLDADMRIGTIYKVTVIPLSVLGIPEFTVRAKLLWSNDVAERMGFQFVDEEDKRTVVRHLKKVIK
jgi:hypothetical protein